MRKSTFLLGCCCLLLAGCGGSDGSSGGGMTVTPGASPSPSPSPTSSPTPTPSVHATISYQHIFAIADGDGGQPNGPLVQASDGNFYCTTRDGGVNLCRTDRIPCGTIFKMTPSGQESVVYSFGASATDAYGPAGGLIQGSDGALYGVSASGGAYGGGTVFRITLDGHFSVLYSFGATSTDGVVPTASLVQGSDGNFYGTTASGGANHCRQIPQDGGNCGTVFKLTPGGTETVVYSFGASLTDAVEPASPLVQASDGNFYGVTVNGGANTCGSFADAHDCGTVYRITPAGIETVLHSFGAIPGDGIAPAGALLIAHDGALYGTTLSGGGGICGSLYGCGTVFRLTTSGALSIIYTFAANGGGDGYGPSSLIEASDGYLYGTTGSGGALGGSMLGTVFRMTSSGALTTLYSFGPNLTGPDATPSNPVGGLIQAKDGAFYGVTTYNGALGAAGARIGEGTVFKLSVQ